MTGPVPPLGAHSLLSFLLQVGVLLLVAVVLGRLAVRLKMPPVVGELCAGILLGPSLLQIVAPGAAGWLVPHDAEQFHLLDAIGQIGVLLLVGVTGSHLDLGLVRRRGATAVKISVSGLVVPLVLGVGTGLLPSPLTDGSRDRTVFALFLAVAMCVSAIPVIAKTLFDMNLLHRDIGQLTLVAGVVDDVFGWVMLSIVSVMATTGLHAANVALSVAYVLGVLLFAAVVGRPLTRKIYQYAQGNAAVVGVTVILILLSAAGTQALGLEAAFGAFVAGILVGEWGKPDPAALAPLRAVVLAVLAPIFFATAGLRMNLTALARIEVLGAALVVLAVAVAGKFAGAYLGARASRLSSWEALALGAGMNARGVIEVIIATVGLRLGVLNSETYTIIILVAVVTSLMAPPILRVAMARIAPTAEEAGRQPVAAAPQ
ncbi:cation:proton antiporter [Planotetraspora sp. A-T 1434]|uniref:cation:proton antiporter n=1 Tax=Planotetraspora sp. A-T 1434 TaxID=2979219 RepID=UPI0021C0DF84|nr:cation:proton antiporter [Planotetraspora sp. A-T 1434]MCT9935405.1 cation:proton antiporter [Planotetraspora sp. A-T 1434]